MMFVWNWCCNSICAAITQWFPEHWHGGWFLATGAHYCSTRDIVLIVNFHTAFAMFMLREFDLLVDVRKVDACFVVEGFVYCFILLSLYSAFHFHRVACWFDTL